MLAFKAFLQKHYGVYSQLESATSLELPDPYLPKLGEHPRMILGISHNPIDDRITTGVSRIPRIREQDIFEDIDKIVPDKNLAKFIS